MVSRGVRVARAAWRLRPGRERQDERGDQDEAAHRSTTSSMASSSQPIWRALSVT